MYLWSLFSFDSIWGTNSQMKIEIECFKLYTNFMFCPHLLVTSLLTFCLLFEVSYIQLFFIYTFRLQRKALRRLLRGLYSVRFHL